MRCLQSAWQTDKRKAQMEAGRLGGTPLSSKGKVAVA